MTAFLFNMPWSQVFDGTGNTLAGAKLYFYDAGTTTLKNIYADSNLTVAQSNPVIADAGGRFAPIYVDGNPFKVILYDANDNLIWSADNITNQSVAESVQFALDAVSGAMSSAGFSGAELTDAQTFSKALFKYGNNALYYDNGTLDNKYVLEPLGNAYLRPDAYFKGMEVIFSCGRPNTSTTPTVNVSGMGEVSIYRMNGTQIEAGKIYGTVHLVYNGNQFLLVDTDFNQFEIGDIKTSVRTSNHNGWLLCNGQAVDRVAYATLFSIIGTNFGAGNGSTTFNVPDYRGKFLRGLGGASAADMYTTQAEGLPNLTGYFGLPDDRDVKVDGSLFQDGGTIADYNCEDAGVDGHRINFNAGAKNPIYGASNHVTPINMAVNYFIKAR